jgi:hypothetical protein
LERYVHKSGLKSEPQLRRINARCIVPYIGALNFLRLKRSDIVAWLDRVEDHASSDLVFPQRFSTDTKKKLEQRIGVFFRQHDLRRLARTMLARLSVSFEVAESILGHRLKGVAGVYDRYDRTLEKGVALQRLDDLIQQIVYPSPANVVPLHGVAS